VITADNNFYGSVNGISALDNYTFNGRNFSQYNISGTVLSLRSNNVITSNRLDGGNTTAIQLSGSHNLVTDNNLTKTGTKAGSGISFSADWAAITDSNILRNEIGNRSYGMSYNVAGDCGYGNSITATGHIITDNNMNGNAYGVANGISCAYTNGLSILRNKISNSSTKGLSLNGTGHTINYNNFITNAANITSGAVTDANYNYWSNHTCGTCNTGICSNAYAFTGGSDNSPYCNPTS
jgi:hypothetical protein